MRLISRRALEAESLNITPLIDVVFLLIIFFLVATSFQRIQRELQVNLPKSKVAKEVSMEIQPISVTVSRDGTITMGDEVVPLKELPERLSAAVASVRNPRVFVRGDAKTFHENIVNVLSACQEAGIRDVSLSTEE
jgi:biopolymer transport protein ExbD